MNSKDFAWCILNLICIISSKIWKEVLALNTNNDRNQELTVMTDMDKKETNELLDLLDDTLQEAVESADHEQVTVIVESISSQEALRQASLMNADDRQEKIHYSHNEIAA